nr:uncharacterized protein LOC103404491 [Malus domestica]
MDDLSINLPVTGETTRPEERNPRRNSTGKIFSLNTGEKIPHYLRASTGSCHDNCKYGRKHEEEVKAKCPIKFVPRRLPTKSPSNQSPEESMRVSKKSIDSQSSVGSEPLAESKKTSSAKPKLPSCLKPHVNAASKTMKQEVSSSLDSCSKPIVSAVPKTMKQAVSPSPDKLEFRRFNCYENRDSLIVRRTGTSFKIRSSALKQVSSPESAGGFKGKSNSDGKIGKRAGASVVTLKKVLPSPRASLSPKPSLRSVAILKAQKNRPVNVVSPLKNQNKIRKAQPKQVNDKEVQEKTLYVIKVETENNKPLESDQNKNCEVEPSPPSVLSTSPKSVSVQNSEPFSSLEGEDEGSGYTMSETEASSFSEDNEADYIDNSEILGKDGKGKPRKSGMVCSEDKDGETLKFRRGKIVDIQFESNNPRRLKFRRGIVLGENQSVKAGSFRRSFKKRGVDADTISTEPGAEKVVLRHQDVQGKKDEKGLFNNVIEETASKLAETRKSKVKALVGAFETVISLQECKPSANAVA